MQLTARLYESRGCVTATKHIGLDSFRVRTCDLSADDRLPIDRASRCWNDDLESGCQWQTRGFCTPNRLIATYRDEIRRTLPIDGVEPQLGLADSDEAVPHEGGQGTCGSAHHQSLLRRFSFAEVDSGRADVEPAIYRFGLVRASGRIAPFFDLFLSPLTNHIPWDVWHLEDASQPGFAQMTWFAVAATDSQNGLRTHTLTRVSDEKRNADERPSTGGKSNRHR